MDSDHAPRIEGRNISLRELIEPDIVARAALGRRVEVVRGFGGSLHNDEAMSEAEAERELTFRFGAGPHWVIADAEDSFVGIVRLSPIDVDNRSARFGVGIFDPDKFGRGFGTEATRLAVRYGFDHLGLHRISLTVLVDNERAVAAYKRVGFEIEGRLRHTLWRDGRWNDDYVMAMLSPPAGNGADATG